MKSLDERREKRKEIESNDKKLLALEREYHKLLDIKWKMPSIPLPVPIQKGYKRFMTLREDIKRRKDADIIQQCLKKVNVTMYCDNAEFERKDWKTGKQIFINPELHPIGVGEWQKYVTLEKWGERQRKYFDFGIRYWSKYGYLKKFEGYWIKDEYMFVPKVEPHFLTHYRDVDPAVETRLKEVKSKLWDNWKNDGRLHKLHGWKGWKHDDWYESTAPQIADDIMRMMVKEYEEDRENERLSRKRN